MSEKEEITFGNEVAKMMIFCVLALCGVKFTFSLFEPYMSCVNFQAPVETFQAPGDSAQS